jgi:hypothetical protein
MATTYPSSGARRVGAPLAEWMVKRGVLFLLLQMPIVALLGGFLLRVTTLAIATYGVFISFAVLTVWVSYRMTVSRDPDEPVHKLHRYALYALLPVAIFSIVRITMFFADDLVYWQLWYAFGAQLTGEPVAQLGTLAAGMVMYTLQGMGLVMGYYVLFRRHTLLNAMLFLGGTLPVIYLYALPVLSMPDAAVGPAWYVTHWLAHVAMAVTAWAAPIFWSRTWPVLERRARVPALAGFVLLLALPYAFAVERAANWQFGEQRRIDLAAFDRVTVQHSGQLAFAGAREGERRYTFELTLDRGLYTNAAGVPRVVDAGPVDVEGQLIAGDTPVAWCTGHVARQPSPNTIRDPAAFAVATRQIEPVVVPVSCAGPAASIDLLCAAGDASAKWSVNAALAGERATQRRQFTGRIPIQSELARCAD